MHLALFLHLAPQFLQVPTQWMPLDRLALEAGRAYIPGTQRTLTIGETSSRPATRVLHSWQTEIHAQSVCDKGLCACPAASA